MPEIDFPDPGAAQNVAYAVQLALGAVFLVSVVGKLRRPASFRDLVVQYAILPRFATPAAALVLAGEAFLASAFLSGRLMGFALALALALIAAFAGATAVNLRRGRKIDCGCFGAGSEEISGRTLARLGVLAVAALGLSVALASGAARATEASWLADQGWPSVAYVVAVAGLSVFGTVVAAWLIHARELAVVIQRVRQSP